MEKRSPIVYLVGIIILVIIGYVSWSAFKEARRNNQIEKEIEELRQEAGKIQTDNQELKEKISYFETQDFQEKVAKEKLNLQKEDEQVVIIKTSPAKKEEVNLDLSAGSQVALDPRPNYQKWWDYFFQY